MVDSTRAGHVGQFLYHLDPDIRKIHTETRKNFFLNNKQSVFHCFYQNFHEYIYIYIYMCVCVCECIYMCLYANINVCNHISMYGWV